MEKTMDSNWVLVIITAVYVVATICICVANFKSANASKKQLEESTKQYEENKRLEAMPYLQFDSATGSLTDYKMVLSLVSGDTNGGTNPAIFEIKNIGRGTVKDIMFDWENLSGQKTDKEWFPIKSLCSGDLRTINLNFLAPREKPEKEKAVFTFYYTDLLENMYIQPVELFFVKGSLLSVQYKNHNTQPPKYIGKKPNEYNETIEEQ